MASIDAIEARKGVAICVRCCWWYLVRFTVSSSSSFFFSPFYFLFYVVVVHGIIAFSHVCLHIVQILSKYAAGVAVLAVFSLVAAASALEAFIAPLWKAAAAVDYAHDSIVVQWLTLKLLGGATARCVRFAAMGFIPDYLRAYLRPQAAVIGVRLSSPVSRQHTHTHTPRHTHTTAYPPF